MGKLPSRFDVTLQFQGFRGQANRLRRAAMLSLKRYWCSLPRTLMLLLCSAWLILCSLRLDGLGWVAPPLGEVQAAEALASPPLPPTTLGLETPIGTEELGKDLLLVDHSDRLLDREVGERLRGFWPVRELLTAFNREFTAPEASLVLSVTTCPRSTSVEVPNQAIHGGQFLTLCYGQLQAMDDYADDLSGSLTEQHLAVLDMVYFVLARELSRIILEAYLPEADGSSTAAAALSIQPSALQAFEPGGFAKIGKPIENAAAHVVALDQLTASLPQRLQLRQQTGVLSGTQWLFNQGRPLLNEEQLRSWTGEALSLDNYQRLVCTAEALYPRQFPFLEQELPAEFALEDCP